VGQEFVQRRVQEPYRYRQTVHDAVQLEHVGVLELLQRRQVLLARSLRSVAARIMARM
jgi:hypothetical protein